MSRRGEVAVLTCANKNYTWCIGTARKRKVRKHLAEVRKDIAQLAEHKRRRAADDAQICASPTTRLPVYPLTQSRPKRPRTVFAKRYSGRNLMRQKPFRQKPRGQSLLSQHPWQTPAQQCGRRPEQPVSSIQPPHVSLTSSHVCPAHGATPDAHPVNGSQVSTPLQNSPSSQAASTGMYSQPVASSQVSSVQLIPSLHRASWGVNSHPLGVHSAVVHELDGKQSNE